MDLRQFRYFSAVAETLNFTRAAEQLRVAQPALSRQIRNLEEELGVKLLERDSRRVTLTDEGRSFLEDIREILELVEAAEARVKRANATPSHVFKLGYAPTLTAPWLPQIFSALRTKLPRMKISLSDLSNEAMIEMIRACKLDAGIMPEQAVPRAGVFMTQTLRKIGFEVVLPIGHPLTKRKKLKVRELCSECLVTYDRREYPEYYNSLQRIFAAEGEPLLPGLEVNSGESLLTSVREWQGIAIVASPVRLTSPAGLEFRPLDPAPEGFNLCLVWHRDLPVRDITPIQKEIQTVFASTVPLASDITETKTEHEGSANGDKRRG